MYRRTFKIIKNSLEYVARDQRGFFGNAGGTSEYGRGFIDGLITENDTDADHDIKFNAGQCRDSTNDKDIDLDTATIKQIDAIWAAGTGNGGLFSGTVANSTWYHMFAISDGGSTVDAGFDTDIDCANIPTGYTNYRRVGSCLTDGSANILSYTQTGDWFWWADPIHDVDVTNLGTSSVSYTLSVPPDVRVLSALNLTTKSAAGTLNVYVRCPDIANDEAPSGTAPGGTIRSVNTNQAVISGPHLIMTNTSKQIAARSNIASTEFDVATLGWMDFRGKE